MSLMANLYPEGPVPSAWPQPAAVLALQAQADRMTTRCGDGHIVWHRWGAAQNAQPALVLFHGGSGSWTHFYRNIEALVALGREVWAPDLPGFGDSTPSPSGPDADAMVEPLHEGLKALLGRRPCDLMGFSFGGMTAGLLLAAHPEAAQRLVLVGAPAMGVVPQRQFELKAWRHLTDLHEQANVHRYNLGALMLHDKTLIDDFTLQLHAANVVRDRLPRRRLAHTDILARSLPLIPCPVHAIYGAHDALYKSWIGQLEAAFASAAADFRGMTLIPGAGHWVQFESPQAFQVALERALA
jgi:pimeloyl-ACP methyl ester carboxylesterase